MSILRWISSLAVALWLSMQPARAGVMERWVYCAQNLWVDKNIDHLEEILRRAAKAGYTHVLLTDSKFAKLGDMDAHYFRNVERVKKLAAELRLEIVPALFPIGYSNDLLWHDPNLIEALPVREALCVVRNGADRAKSGAPPLPSVSPFRARQNVGLQRHAGGKAARRKSGAKLQLSGRERDAGLDRASRRLQLARPRGGEPLPRLLGRKHRLALVGRRQARGSRPPQRCPTRWRAADREARGWPAARRR